MKAEKQQDGNILSIQTRFGVVKLNLENTIKFPSYILGMEGLTDYCFVDYPDEKYNNFKLLQSVEDPEVTFVVYPLTDNKIYDKSDLDECINNIKFECNKEDIVFTLIVGVQRDIDGKMEKVTVNLRAPIVIDTTNKVGHQYIFYNGNYSIRHQIL